MGFVFQLCRDSTITLLQLHGQHKGHVTYCKKDSISILPALVISWRLSCLNLGQMFTRDFSLEQGELT